MDTSVFKDQKVEPLESDLPLALNETYDLWKNIRDCVYRLSPDSTEEWNYSGKKFGWSFRIKDKKRVIIYLLPREGYFKVAFVFGQKATDSIRDSNVADAIKNELQEAKVYAEGRGIRIDIRDTEILKDIEQLIEFKLAF